MGQKKKAADGQVERPSVGSSFQQKSRNTALRQFVSWVFRKLLSTARETGQALRTFSIP